MKRAPPPPDSPRHSPRDDYVADKSALVEAALRGDQPKTSSAPPRSEAAPSSG